MTHTCTYRFSPSLFIQIVFWILLIYTPLSAQTSLDSTYSFTELNENLKLARDNKDIKELAVNYYLLANFEAEINANQIQAFDYYTRAIEYYRILDDIEKINEIKYIIGNRYADAGLYKEAVDQYEELLTYYEENDNLYMRTYLFAKLADVYHITGNIDQEYEYLNQSIDLNRELRDTSLMIDFMLKKSRNYMTLNEKDSALVMSFQAFKMANKVNDKLRLSNSLFDIAQINFANRDYKKALKYYKDAELIIPKKPYSTHRRDIYMQLSEVYDSLDRHEDAYDYALKYAFINDSILNQDKVKAEYKLALRFETNEKKKDIANLEQEKEKEQEKNKQQSRALYFLSAGLAMLLALVYFIIRFYTTRIRAEKIITQQEKEIRMRKIKTLEDDVKMKGMQSMITGQEMERERIAQDLHDSLGGLLSTVKLQFDSVQSKNANIKDLEEYKNANKLLDSAVEEVRSISRNLQPGALAELGLVPALKDLINNFDGEHYPDVDLQVYDIPKKIDNIVSLSIFRVIQELLYNSVKHAKASEILIQVNKENDELVIQFEDDGVGFDMDNLKHKGMGLENIKSRIDFLKGSILFDSKEGEGLSVLIHVHYQ